MIVLLPIALTAPTVDRVARIQDPPAQDLAPARVRMNEICVFLGQEAGVVHLIPNNPQLKCESTDLVNF